MTRFEYLDWRFYLWRKRRRCRRHGHDNIGQPELTVGGWHIRRCYSCGSRLDERRIMTMNPAEAGREMARWL